MVRLAHGRDHQLDLAVGDRPRVEQQPPAAPPGRPRARPRRRSGAASAGSSATDRTVQFQQGQRAPADPGARPADPCARPGRLEPRAQALGPRRQLGLGRSQHGQHRDLAPPARSRCRRSVASSAASESLSIRRARASGWAAAALDRLGAARPAGRPAVRRGACRPSSRPAPRRPRPTARSVGSSARSLVERPRADVVDHRPPRGRTAPRSARRPRTRRSGSSTGGRASPRPRPPPEPARGSRPARVRLVVPTSISREPDWAITSGMRKPPPISTS